MNVKIAMRLNGFSVEEMDLWRGFKMMINCLVIASILSIIVMLKGLSVQVTDATEGSHSV